MCKTGKYGFVLVSCLMLLFASGCSAGTGTGEMQSGAQSDAVCLADAAGIHRYEKTVVEPTCTEAGYTQFICGCGASVRDERVLPTGHRYEGYIVEPTYAAEGYTRHVCSVCEAWYTDTYTPMLSDLVSPLAEKEYLLPLEDFSGARTQDPEYVMVHFVSAAVLSRKNPYDHDLVRGIFTDNRISVHYMIDRDGNISCYIPEERVAYHAGYGTWGEDPRYTNRMNEYAIGIEMMAIGSRRDMAQYMTAKTYRKLKSEHIGFTDAQYDALQALVNDICSRNDIPMDREHVIGHEEYSPAKTDPGELFDWGRLFP